MVPPSQPTEPCLVYLDCTALLDLILPIAIRPRHNAANQLLALVQRHYRTELLRLVTSIWATTECQSILYEEELKSRGVVPPKSKKLRDIVPPNKAALSAATKKVEALKQTLFATTHDFLFLPDPSRVSMQLLQLTQELTSEAGFYPPDSIHLALALESDCSIIVTDDRNFLNKIDCCQAQLIQPYRRRRFSQLPTSPPFHAHALEPTTTKISGQRNRNRLPALQALNALGFV